MTTSSHHQIRSTHETGLVLGHILQTLGLIALAIGFLVWTGAIQ